MQGQPIIKLLYTPERKSAPKEYDITCDNCDHRLRSYKRGERQPPANFAIGEETYVWCDKYDQKPKTKCADQTSCLDCEHGEEWHYTDKAPWPFTPDEDGYSWCNKHQMKIEYSDNWPCEYHSKYEKADDESPFLDGINKYTDTPEDLKDEPVSEWILENFKDNIMYVMSKGDKGEYYVYDGCKWIPDKKKQYQHFIIKGIKAIINQLKAEAEAIEPKTVTDKYGKVKPTEEYAKAADRVSKAKRYLDYGKIKDIWSLMQGKVAIDNREFDTNYNILNFKNGTLDIITWKLRKHQPSDMLTKCMAAEYNETALCPKFDDEISRSFKDAKEKEWLQIFYGGALARRPQKKFYHMNGTADAGKTTILNTIMKVLGDDGKTGYAAPLPPDTFSSSKAHQATRNDLLMTRHCCIMGIDEQKSDERQDSSLAKGYTGGSLLNVRGLYEENQLLPPSCTIINTCNKLPPLDVSDQGMISRQVVIPFEYPIAKKIPEYWNILYNEECDAIAWWLLEGLKKYLSVGLPDLPERFKNATSKYVRDNNIVDRFNILSCKIGDGKDDVNYRMTLDAYYTSFKNYCQHVEGRQEKYIPGMEKVVELLDMRGIKLSAKPCKIADELSDGTITRKAARNVLMGIRFKNKSERQYEIMDALKDEPIAIGELPMEIHLVMMEAPRRIVDFNMLNKYFEPKGIDKDVLINTLDKLKARGEIMSIGPGEYQLV
jgi:putative DNA primase/helicase